MPTFSYAISKIEEVGTIQWKLSKFVQKSYFAKIAVKGERKETGVF